MGVTGTCFTRGWRSALILAIVLLAIIPYVPAQRLPLIADDYVQLDLGGKYGPVSAWPKLAGDALYRCRATSILITHWTVELFGVLPLALNLTSLAVHVVNSVLVLLLGFWKEIGWRVAALSALAFACIEGHQEAVIWYAALPELLVFTFVILTFLLWIRFIQEPRGRWVSYAGCLTCFVLALLSKESAVCVVALQGLAIVLSQWRKWASWIALLPFAALSAVYFLAIYQAKSTHLHLNDGTFSLSAPFLYTLLNSGLRLLWVWGIVGLAILIALRQLKLRFLLISMAWIGATLLPYSFLTYMSRVPSRHTYLASVAAAWILAAALIAIHDRLPQRRILAGALGALFVAHQCVYLWTVKQRQYELRAAPTDDLLRFARRNRGAIVVNCFEYGPDVGILALDLAIAPGQSRRLHWSDPQTCKGHEFYAIPSAPTAAAVKPEKPPAGPSGVRIQSGPDGAAR